MARPRSSAPSSATTSSNICRSRANGPRSSGTQSLRLAVGARRGKQAAMPTRKKIGLIGAGNIGGELARLCANAELGDVVLFDIPAKENFAKGKALDLEQNSSVLGYDAKITGSSNWADLEGSDVLIITAGIPRKPGQSRDDLVAVNLPIIRDVANNAKKHCPDAFVIVISNPLDAMVYEYKRVTGCPKGKVAGMAGV